MKIIHLVFFIILVLFDLNGQFQQIILDENYEDWNDVNSYQDDLNDNPNDGLDLKELWISNDKDYLFLRMDLKDEINLQEGNNLVLYIDIDNDPTSGFDYRGIGAEIVYYFGDRQGAFYGSSSTWFIEHADIGLITSPTVSSNQFEILIKRRFNIVNDEYFIDGNIKVILEDERISGDIIPSEFEGFPYEIDFDNMQEIPNYSFNKDSKDLRILSYNVQFDGIFENPSQASILRILRALVPDIIAFQEIYDQGANATRDLVQQVLGGTWYTAKLGPDIICVSKYPILAAEPIDGNGAFLIDIDGSQILLINVHLPCCSNDFSRQREVDAIIAYIRELKSGNTGISIAENTPIMIMGDMNFVGDRQQVESFKTGQIINTDIYGSGALIEWDDSELDDANPITTNLPASITWYQENSSFNPGRLDYVFYTGSVIEVNNSFNLFTERLSSDELNAFNLESFDSSVGSDHLPLVVDFDFDFINSANSLDFIKDEIVIYPNPAHDKLYLTIPDDFEINKLAIYNLDGKQLLSQINYSSPFIDISSLNSGMYFLLVEGNNEKVYLSFVKN